jgi:uracil-DNA glycosylase
MNDDTRETRLDEPHVRPLMDLVRGLQARGYDVPNVDPCDGGIAARALFLLETPGPRAVGTRFVSRDNPDLSAKNIGKALADAQLGRADTLLWNVVPYCISTVDRNANASMAQIRAAAPSVQNFIDALPCLAVVVFCGGSAQRAIRLLRFPDHVAVLRTFHPGAQAYNHARCRVHIHQTFKEARRLFD